MKIHVESETKCERCVSAAKVSNDTANGEIEFNTQIEHSFYVRVVDPKSEAWSPANTFSVLAAMLPPGTQCGDEFHVFFERVKTPEGQRRPLGITPTYPIDPVPR